ncbi:MAG: Gx transporter family protein [Spirochaetaceae bacterium]|jgi:heptaprenyl diphosphate synthase|nr:Gx transporter family protein [Spirochaetaceae bacterium]
MVNKRPAAAPQLISLFGALCAFLSAIEYLFPKPLPFLRLGLSNIPLMLALFFDARSFFALLAVKIMSAALLSGSLFSYIFLLSAAGGLSSGLVMFTLHRLLGETRISFAGLGVCGALASNLAQLVLARYAVLGKGALLLVPPFIAFATVSGMVMGVLCGVFSAGSRWYAGICSAPASPSPAAAVPAASAAVPAGGKSAAAFFCAGLCAAAAVIITQDIKMKAIQFICILIIFIVLRNKNNYLLSCIFFLSIIIFNMIVPYGRVLAEIGRFRLTEGSLMDGLRKALTMQSLIFISRICIKKEITLPGKAGAVISGTFRCLAYLNKQSTKIDRKNLIKSIDAILINMSKAET